MPAQSAPNSTPENRDLISAQPSSPINSVQLKSTPAQNSSESSSPWGESAELLRWRADMLMDEMMLGAVDVYAGEPKANGFNHSASAYSSPSDNRSGAEGGYTERPTNGNGHTNGNSNGNGHNGHTNGNGHDGNGNGYKVGPAPSESAAPNRQVDKPDQRAPSTPQPFETNRSAYIDRHPTAEPTRNEPTRNEPAPEPGQREPKAWIFSAEARYQQIARNQQVQAGNSSAVDSVIPSAFAPSSPQAQPWMAEEQHVPVQPESNSLPEMATPELGPMRRAAPQLAGAMATPHRNGKWSNLLPRMSATDSQSLQQEITTLHSEMSALLPASHESCKHAHHLLEKAQTILQDDDSRLAEVEYYIQQVRTIFQRTQQTLNWSNLYRNRLSIYLGAWSLLGLIVLVARYVYQVPIESFVRDSAGLATDSFVLQNFVTALSTVFAGALGGALGALINLRLRTHLEHGFFDRKYGLRGLILPVMGALFGLVLYLIVALLFYISDLDPSLSLGISTLPILLAFAFGACQESIYGTRG